ncbi:vWA domain-containing protein [Marinobacter mobilis]|uniref:TIGR03503 family protein n=1 Tax=Marinobacter mobilis TaxID=488533 RepID=A0A1H2UZN4_9GAMM|nr:vWA domain-containing protein [Marinobacter mobilis]SDW61109.1 TIGR03503 family protein [Marinobacter mobilis]
MVRILSRLIMLGCLALPFHGNAQSAVPQIPPQQDVRIIVDISGSMRQTDPLNLRQPAVRLLARLLPENATAGVWTFGQYVNMLVPHGAVTDAWRDRAVESSAEINSVALRTNLGKALEVASDGYYSDEDLSNTHFILLTDGKVDVSEDRAINEQERVRVVNDVLSQLADAHATIHTIALSQAADLELLERFAERTGGSFTLAESADDLNLAFLRSLNSAVPQEQIPIEGNQFLVDEGVEEFTALIFPGDQADVSAQGLTLVDPLGVRHTTGSHSEAFRWVSEPGYDLITVTDPPAGEWQVAGPLGQGSQVTVVSDLRMVLSPLPSRFTEQEPVSLEAMFYEQAEAVTDPDFLGVIEVSVTLTSSDGRSGTKTLSPERPPEDGVYRDEITRLPFAGDFTVEVVANGKTFSRKFSQALTFVVPETDGDEAVSTELPEPDATVENADADSLVAADPESDVQPALPEDAVSEGGVEMAAETAEPLSAGDSLAEPMLPIDITAVEAPAPAASVEPSPKPDESDRTVWYIALGAGGVVVIATVAVLLWRRKSATQPAADMSTTETPLADELDDEPAEAEAEAQVPDEAAPDVAEASEEEKPEAEEIPQLEEDVAEDEEFGLEDFDLSDIDDFDESATDDEESEDASDDKDEKKR